ncbi:MAG TPA: biopolymer transporter ExbD, partial [Terricaulis sp.]|nr:biopolymer transporter ExbD [Terricaulis sp.]
SRTRDMHPQADPNVIPFIDVLLVLLIIFMVTAPKPTTDLKVDMPPPVPGPASRIEPTIVELRAAPSGYAVFVSGAETDMGALGARALAHIRTANPALEAGAIHAEARVFVRSDLDVAYAPVVAVVEALKFSGFENVSIVAQRAD